MQAQDHPEGSLLWLYPHPPEVMMVRTPSAAWGAPPAHSKCGQSSEEAEPKKCYEGVWARTLALPTGQSLGGLCSSRPGLLGSVRSTARATRQDGRLSNLPDQHALPAHTGAAGLSLLTMGPYESQPPRITCGRGEVPNQLPGLQSPAQGLQAREAGVRRKTDQARAWRRRHLSRVSQGRQQRA